ncbi:Endonuclease/exonuclease/phosphatase [Rhodovastum atsumiense]|uniref:endonuclease/exonuclease/phosphatase family protein n=1 Tax=Rhodovastum atsumiense TaxID=504468 RepID=UPI001EEF7BB7|nr:endonuclease/exonuclease/phosphatase family protein [Rhodovastum atsumiense]CAH2599325.1 Endonuclease/exonuclease/phosphatase [Rhodovastum atsumiense]
MRVLTWNIHGGVGLDDRFDLERIIATVRHHDSEIVALQEVEGRARPGVFATLCEACGRHAATAVTMWEGTGGYGHLLASRWPIHDTRIHDLSVPGREPRCVLAARIATPVGPLHVLSTHLGLAAAERRCQGDMLARLAAATPDPLLLLGDLNDWIGRGPVWRRLRRVLPAWTRARTFPAAFPILPLDRIFARPAGLLAGWQVDRGAAGASDHLPLLGEIRLQTCWPPLMCSSAPLT